MRTGVRRGETEGQRGSGLAWPILKKFLDTRGGGISCLRSRVERRSSCSSEATGDPAGSARAQGRHWGLEQGRSILSPGPGRRFPSPEAGQPPRALVPPHPHPRSLCTLRPRPPRTLGQDVGTPAERRPRPQASLGAALFIGSYLCEHRDRASSVVSNYGISPPLPRTVHHTKAPPPRESYFTPPSSPYRPRPLGGSPLDFIPIPCKPRPLGPAPSLSSPRFDPARTRGPAPHGCRATGGLPLVAPRRRLLPRASSPCGSSGHSCAQGGLTAARAPGSSALRLPGARPS